MLKVAGYWRFLHASIFYKLNAMKYSLYGEHLENFHTVIPLHPIINGACGCGNSKCGAAGKHAKGTGWQNYTAEMSEKASESERQNYGVLLPQSGIIVVDIDGRNGGFNHVDSFQLIRLECGYIVESGSGFGEHWYFYLPSEWRGKKLKTSIPEYKGIDFKSTGYVVGEGSMHSAGNKYTCVRGEIAKITEAPSELLELLEQKTVKKFTVDNAQKIAPQELAKILEYIDNPNRDYDLWLAVGMALHHATEGSAEGERLWEHWTNSQPSVAPRR